MIMSPQQLRRYAEGGAAEPYIAGINVNETSMDGNTQQLLYGLDGQNGFIPGAMRATERSFFDEQGRPLVTPQEIANFSPDQQAAFEMAREQVGSQTPFLEASQQAYEQGLGALGQGQQAQLGSQQQSLSELQRATGIQDFQSQRGLGDALGGINRGQRETQLATDQLRGDLRTQQQQALQSQQQFDQRSQGVEDLSRGAASRFDQRLGAVEQRGDQDLNRFQQDLARSETTGFNAADRFGGDLSRVDALAQRSTGDFDRGLTGASGELAGGAARQRQALGQQGQMLQQSGSQFARDLGGIEGLARGAEGQFSGQVGQATQGLSRSVDELGGGLAGSFSRQEGAVGRLGQGLGQATTSLQGAEQKLNQELNQALGQERGAVDRFTSRQGEATDRLGASVDRFGNRLSQAEQRGISALDDYSTGLDESRGMLRGSVGAFDPSSTSQYMNPYEDSVVNQMIQDATKGLAQSDMAQTASDIRSGGESAFGSRARLTAAERAEAMGRGLAKEVGGLRAQGFQNAQSTAMNEFARQQGAQKGAAEGLASLGGQGLTAQTRAADTLSQGAASRLSAQINLYQEECPRKPPATWRLTRVLRIGCRQLDHKDLVQDRPLLLSLVLLRHRWAQPSLTWLEERVTFHRLGLVPTRR
jgi:hypothetical protein